MFKRLSLAFAGLFMLAALGTAQDTCSSLSIKTERRTDSFFDVWTEISLAPAMAPTWLMVGLQEGRTEIPLPGNTLILGVQDILATPMIGRTDAEGNVARRFIVPHTIALTLHAQALSADIQRTDRGREVSFCLSNVAPIELH